MDMVCVVCPIGCRLTVEEKNGLINVYGNKCPRGDSYARQELTCPTRVLTTTVSLSDGSRIAVRSSSPLPKDRIFEFVEIIKNTKLPSDISIGDILIENIGETGVSVVASSGKL